MPKAFVFIGLSLIVGCGNSGNPFGSGSACDGYVTCCNGFPEVQRTACLQAVSQVRGQPNADATCAEQLRQWEASGACRAPAADLDAAITDSRPRDVAIESGPIATNGGYSLQVLSVARRSRTQRGTLDVGLRLGVEGNAPSAPLTSSLFRIIGGDGLERIGNAGISSECPESALVAPGATVTCAVSFSVPANVRALRLVYLAPNSTRIEANAPAEQPLPPPPLEAVLTRQGSMCNVSGCDDCRLANGLRCALEDAGTCEEEADFLLECTSDSVFSCAGLQTFYSCMSNNERARLQACTNAQYAACIDRTETNDTACRDNVDNDGDTYIDCEDRECCNVRSDCGPSTFCGQEPEVTLALCRDGVDNDRDTFVDCNDRDCCSPLRTGSQICPYTSYCGGQACPEQPDVPHVARSCAAGTRATLDACLEAGTTPEADQACLNALTSDCATCVAYGYIACISRGTTGVCNQQFNCWDQCAQIACPSGGSSCRQAAATGSCQSHYSAYAECWDAPATESACGNNADDCFVD